MNRKKLIAWMDKEYDKMLEESYKKNKKVMRFIEKTIYKIEKGEFE